MAASDFDSFYGRIDMRVLLIDIAYCILRKLACMWGGFRVLDL